MRRAAASGEGRVKSVHCITKRRAVPVPRVATRAFVPMPPSEAATVRRSSQRAATKPLGVPVEGMVVVRRWFDLRRVGVNDPANAGTGKRRGVRDEVSPCIGLHRVPDGEKSQVARDR